MFENLRLIPASGPVIGVKQFDPATREMTLTWNSRPDRLYTVFHSQELAAPFNPLLSDIESGGSETSATVVLPEGDAGFVQIQEQ